MERTPVTPRALSPECGYPFAIDELIEPYVGQLGAVAIHGPVGFDKRNALAYLGERLRDARLFGEEADCAAVERAASDGLVVYAREEPFAISHLAKLRMAPWDADEVLEYLMVAHRSRCGAVMESLRSDPDGDLLRGAPCLGRAVLDRLAARDPVPPIREALLALAMGPKSRQLPVRVMRVALRLANGVRGQCALRLPRVSRDVIDATAALLAPHPAAERALRALCDGQADHRQPMAASLLRILESDWEPRPPCPILAGAYLCGVGWVHANLACAQLAGADLALANLEAAVLDGADARNAVLRHAHLRDASLVGTDLTSADLSGADLCGVSAQEAEWTRASLRDADLSGADLTEAKFLGTDFRGARLAGAQLARSRWKSIRVAGADFRGADLRGASLVRTDLRKANWDGALLDFARFSSCHMEGMRIADARFEGAFLHGAYMTASHMPGAIFRRAWLVGARLAEVSWEGADLRDAKLDRAVFQMGSTREGLVDSPIACEGSRTGYYTDDFDEQSFKSPEEIRKANLGGADLRGARVHRTDFYLVDLRDAKYDAAQEKHFRRTGAILENKKF
ncbi:MAG: pentapeptide repeat-containing protein [Planctomycetota bacterium]